MIRNFFILIACSFTLVTSISLESSSLEVHSLFGSYSIEDPLIIELLNSKAMDRLKKVDSAGTPRYYYKPLSDNTRYDHSVGVFIILRKFGAPIKEQIAGLLHDISHTAFSHVGDILFFKKEGENSYQDSIHAKYLMRTDISEILSKHGLTIAEIDPKSEKFPALEKDIPELCADRIEYILHVAYLLKYTSRSELNLIIRDLRLKDGTWFFINKDSAEKIGRFSLKITEEFFAAPWNLAMYQWSSMLLQRGLNLKIINTDNIHFGYDRQILDKLYASKDEKIIELIKKHENYAQYFKVEKPGKGKKFTPKFRGVDPLVLEKNKLVQLTHIDPAYKNEFERVKRKMEKGIWIKFLN